MKSICVKTNDSKILYYLLDSLNNITLDNVCFSFNEFKSYKNVIIHYKGNNVNDFINEISNILSLLVIDNYEENIIKKIEWKYKDINASKDSKRKESYKILVYFN